ncbi:cyclic nucleotide-gated cation channel beta-1-like isoform X2 [Salarias fasciatus]|uniref:cyclic nucleotide-gated cation channel beta-1-like isoform X2 n=1 Tax=Salarias fasciatus TaxID=181472 RepID=UPI001176C610|nr:cyclic nucleotide-gated cation channel beta-1-like isoform X2 [Salarias fasciatus]
MLSWVVKVVPHPPEPPARSSEQQREAPPPVEKKVKFQDEVQLEALKREPTRQEVEPAAGNGPVPPLQSVSQTGVLTWISSALPQPPSSPKPAQAKSSTEDEPSASSRPEDETGVLAWFSQGLEKVVPRPELRIKEAPAAAEQEEEVCVAAAAPEPLDGDQARTFPPSMMQWVRLGLQKVVPQPETLVPEEAEAPPTTTNTSTSEPIRMMGWIERMLPQPVVKTDTKSDDVIQICPMQKETDLVLEDVEDREDQVQNSDPPGSLKEEAGHMEERLEAARLAEAAACRAAQEAVRQLEAEHSARIVMETLPDNEQLPNILEEENEDDPELQKLQDDSDDGLNPDEAKGCAGEQGTVLLLDVCPASPSSTDAEPASENRDLETPASQPITAQPGAAEAPPPSAGQVSGRRWRTCSVSLVSLTSRCPPSLRRRMKLERSAEPPQFVLRSRASCLACRWLLIGCAAAPPPRRCAAWWRSSSRRRCCSAAASKAFSPAPSMLSTPKTRPCKLRPLTPE